MKTINLKSLGVLERICGHDNLWESQEIAIPYFNNLRLKFIIWEGENKVNDDFDEAISNFLNLNEEDRLKASQYVYKNYKEFVEAVGEDELDFNVEERTDIWQYVKPTEIMVSRREKDHLIYVQILAKCDWEREHGLQIIYRNGKELSRVSQPGHLTHSDAYGLPESEDKIC